MTPSSIFSSERSVLTLGAAALGILLAALLRPPVFRDSASQRPYWTLKKGKAGVCELVVAGDSRVFQGVSPAEMAGRLGGRDILNFGFASCGWTEEYLDAVRATLKPGPGARVVVLGVTPASLAPRSAMKNGFLSAEPGPLWEAALRWKARGALERLDPLPLQDLRRRLLGRASERPRDTFVYHDDGWVAARGSPWRPDFQAERIPLNFKDNRVDPARVDALLRRVSAWTREGLRVFAFRPPTNAATLAAEERHAGFDERDFAERFRLAGGRWIDVRQTGYDSYDGSHLNEDAARAFSRDLADALSD